MVSLRLAQLGRGSLARKFLADDEQQKAARENVHHRGQRAQQQVDDPAGVGDPFGQRRAALARLDVTALEELQRSLFRERAWPDGAD